MRHGVFTHAVLNSLRAKGTRRGVTWSALVDQVQEDMASAEFKKLVPDGYTQTPIPTSGQLPRTGTAAGSAGGKNTVELDLGGGVKLKMRASRRRASRSGWARRRARRIAIKKMRSSTRWSSATITTLGSRR